MPRWVITVAGAVAAALLYGAMAYLVGGMSIGTVIVGSILFAGVGAMVTGVFVADRSRRRQPRT
jgi:hypothetical protein